MRWPRPLPSTVITTCIYLLLLFLAFRYQRPCAPCGPSRQTIRTSNVPIPEIWRPESRELANSQPAAEKAIADKAGTQNVKGETLIPQDSVSKEQPPVVKIPTAPVDTTKKEWPRVQIPDSVRGGSAQQSPEGSDNVNKQWPRIQAPAVKVDAANPSVPQMGDIKSQWPQVKAAGSDAVPAPNSNQQKQGSSDKWPRISAPKAGSSTNGEKVSLEEKQQQPVKEDQKTSKSIALGKGELVMITGSSGTSGFLGVPNLKQQVYENRRSYAEKWGHEFMWANLSSYEHQQLRWNKVPIMREAQTRFPDAKWFWWLDVDAMIMDIDTNIWDHILSREGMERNLIHDQEVPGTAKDSSDIKTLAKMNPDNVNCLMTRGYWGLSTGSFFFKRSEWTDMVLEMWNDPLLMQQDWTYEEQDGWAHLFKYHEVVRKHTGIVEQRAINGHSRYKALGDHWQPGDFLAHFDGCGASKDVSICQKEWEDYWALRKPYEEYEWIREQIANGTALIESTQRGVF